ncbi:hypothetical protein HQ46_09890 [Porphyromonas gulae]|nr:hypothetical protein HQ46_09890 [Porphyromonas gulae]
MKQVSILPAFCIIKSWEQSNNFYRKAISRFINNCEEVIYLAALKELFFEFFIAHFFERSLLLDEFSCNYRNSSPKATNK